MVNPSDFRNGMTIEWEGGLWVVLEFQQGQNARGDTFFRTKLRNVRTGAVTDRTFNAGVNVGLAIVERHEMQYLYRDGDSFVFMDTASYDQHPVPGAVVGDAGPGELRSAAAQ